MKRLITLICIFSTTQLTAQTGIGTTTPNTAAKLDVSSTDKGLLIPRMTKSQREAITLSAAANGLLVYQTDDLAGFYVNTSTTTTIAWTRVNTDWTRYSNNINYSLGNVGIGTVTPSEKLDVNGNVRATSFIGSGSQLTGVPTNIAHGGTIIPYTAAIGATYVDLVSFELPSAGTWRVTRYLRTGTNLSNSFLVTWLTLNNNAEYDNSRLLSSFGVANFQTTTTMVDYVTVTGTTILKLRAYSPNSSVDVITDNNGVSKLVFEKIQ